MRAPRQSALGGPWGAVEGLLGNVGECAFVACVGLQNGRGSSLVGTLVQSSNAEALVQISSDEAQARLSSPMPEDCSTADCSSSCASCSPWNDGGKP